MSDYDFSYAQSVEKRFYRYIIKSEDPNACWGWRGATDSDGYGILSVFVDYPKRRTTKAAHRIAYEIYNGDIPEGMKVLHSCDNTLCPNPFHLFLGTDKDNAIDKIAKGRSNSPRRAKITMEDARKIRGLYAGGNTTQRELSKSYNITSKAIRKILGNITWKEVQIRRNH